VFLYWFFFISFSFLSINPISIEKNISKILKYFLLFLLIFFMGLRHQVGGDWDLYLRDFYSNIELYNFFELDYVRDFGYETLSFICFQLGIGIYGLNFIIATFFIISLNRFSMEFSKNYWLSLVISFPYLITVVGMGYTRQGCALAFILLSLVTLKKNKIFACYIYLILAILFHKSAVIMVPIIFLTYFRFNLTNILIILVLIYACIVVISPELARIQSGYFSDGTKYVSSGVYYRLFLNILAGFCFLLFYKKIKTNYKIDNLVILVLFITIGLSFFAKEYSTFVDRVIIYFTFIQIIVFSRLSSINEKYRIVINICVIFIYSLIFFTWLYFANHSYTWVPYNNLIFELLR
jgi:hypothetical protein